jgi:hypothetical protein
MTSLVVGLLFGIVIMLLVTLIRRASQPKEEEEPDFLDNLVTLGNWLFQTYGILKKLTVPSKGKKRKGTAEHNVLYQFLLDQGLIVKAKNTGEEDYVVSDQGKNFCEFLEEASKKAGCQLEAPPKT